MICEPNQEKVICPVCGFQAKSIMERCPRCGRLLRKSCANCSGCSILSMVRPKKQNTTCQ